MRIDKIGATLTTRKKWYQWPWLHFCVFNKQCRSLGVRRIYIFVIKRVIVFKSEDS